MILGLLFFEFDRNYLCCKFYRIFRAGIIFKMVDAVVMSILGQSLRLNKNLSKR